MSIPPLATLQRNRMLAQRELQWTSEQRASSDAIDLLEEDTGYRTLTNVLSNYLWMTLLIWGFEVETNKTIIDKALLTENSLSIWGDSSSSLDTIENWITRGRKWSISDLSQLMRLFVVVVEAIDSNIKDSNLSDFNRVVPKNLKMMLLDSENYKFVGEGLHRFGSNYQLITLDKEVDDQLKPGQKITRWDLLVRTIKSVTEYVVPANPSLTLFKKRSKTSAAGISPSGPRSRKSVYTVRDRLLGLNDDDIDSKRRLARMLSHSSSGTSLHSIQPDSLIGGLEWIYGLPGGADTSGTTAEVFGVCWLLSDYLPEEELDEIANGIPWYLGPALAIVSNTHHTYLEFAIAVYVGELLRTEGKVNISYIPGKYHTILNIGTVPPFRVEDVNPLNSTLLQRVYKRLYDSRVEQTRYIFSPESTSWSSSDVNQISILGGTISNDYTYHTMTQAQIDKLNVGQLIDIGAKVLKSPPSSSDSTTVINLQLKTIYKNIISQMT